PKSTTSNTLTTSSQSTTSAQATKLNISLELNSLSKKRKAADQEAIRQLSSELFHEHKQISDEEVKKLLKNKLENDKDCAEQLQYLKEKGFSFDKLWNEKFYSDVNIGILYFHYFAGYFSYSQFTQYQQMLSANRIKKRYYVRRIKEDLWVLLALDSKKVYEELYNLSDPNNPNSNIFLALIIKYAFIFEDKRTHANAIWTQTVLELIFDENYLLAKLDSDVNKKDLVSLLKTYKLDL
ncbi:5256_t:CDS:2, partial [Racocetra persica]